MNTLRSVLAAALSVASLALAASPACATVRIRVDLGAQRLTATNGAGETVTWKISSGRRGYETPTGSFKVYRMEADHFSDEYDQAPMPYAMFFSPRGLAIHGTSERGLGRPASHGCVRLSTPHAQQLFGWVEKSGATVEITGGGARLAPRGERSQRPRLTRRPRQQEAPPAVAPQPAVDQLSQY